MKWVQGAIEEIVVAAGRGPGSALTQLSHPHEVLVDATGTVYVVDYRNHRVQKFSVGKDWIKVDFKKPPRDRNYV